MWTIQQVWQIYVIKQTFAANFYMYANQEFLKPDDSYLCFLGHTFI